MDPVIRTGEVARSRLPPDPFVALVIRPWASTVIVALVYVLGVTVVLERAIVPDVVMGPPVNPVPVLTEVTVPVAGAAGRMFVIVKEPLRPGVRLMPVPAFKERTPVLVTLTMPPTLADTEIPEPAGLS